MAKAPKGWANVDYDYVRLGGGLDLTTPTLQLKPGTARDATNFECSLTGGYTRIKGYERFSGQDSPSECAYTALRGTLNDIRIGSTIKQYSTGAFGVLARIDPPLAGDNLGSVIVLADVVGVFKVGNDLYYL